MSEANEQARPAILGGEPIRPQGPPLWPPAWEEVLQAIARSMEEGTWGSYHGPNVRVLAERLASYHGVEFVELCCSGTFAVELAMRSMRIGAGDEVILADYDFIGNFNSIIAVGARAVLIDIDAESRILDPNLIAQAVGPETRAILVSHLHGVAVPMKAVMNIARERGLLVIEDACQMPGAMIEGRRAGAWGDVGVISFGGSKLLSAGRGGALLTSSAEVRQRAQVYCNRGNHAYPLSELQATALLPQLERLDARNQKRSASVSKLADRLANIEGLRLLMDRVESTSPGYYKIGFQYDVERFGGLSREKFVRATQAEGIEFNVGYRAFHLCRSSRHFRKAGDLAIAASADADMLMLHHPVLLEGDESLDEISGCVRKIRHWAETIEQSSSI